MHKESASSEHRRIKEKMNDWNSMGRCSHHNIFRDAKLIQIASCRTIASKLAMHMLQGCPHSLVHTHLKITKLNDTMRISWEPRENKNYLNFLKCFRHLDTISIGTTGVVSSPKKVMPMILLSKSMTRPPMKVWYNKTNPRRLILM